MILSLLVGMISLYPWNVNLSGYGTVGAYSDDRVHQSESVYLSFDRRQRDQVIVGLEYTEEREEGDATFDQLMISARGLYWYRTWLRVGATGFALPRTGETPDWGGGITAEGYWRGYTYRVAYTRMQVDRQSDQSCSFQSVSFGKALGPYHVEISPMIERREERPLGSLTGSISGQVRSNIWVFLSHGFGERRSWFDAVWLISDLNPDTAKRWYTCRVTYKFSSHVYSILGFSRIDYQPYPDDGQRWDYSARFYTLGLKLRY